MSLMVVYNTCGLSGKENSSTYIRHIRTIMNQDLQEKKIVFSGCKIKKETFVFQVEFFKTLY